MSDKDFRDFSVLVYDRCGIHLTPIKKTMLSMRLVKRMRYLEMTSFREYFDYVCTPRGQAEELIHMIDVVTTNKTDFFREPKHFDFLTKEALPTLLNSRRQAALGRLYVWSAGCSSGEEPYTLAMVLEDYLSKNSGVDFSILATDISSRVLATAQQAIYREETVDPVPIAFKRKYLMRGKGSQVGFSRVVPELRHHIGFQRLNLIEGDTFDLKTPMDIIFCRNVVIYFDRPTQIKLFAKFYAQLVPGGYMFIGHSETLNGINNRFVPVSISVYRKPG
ncbi:MAG: protein-glutamate O-methyltransferase [Deltaproteobacteria bacterium]|nr:protein-glutamate O-methyltransferase [Deltaproteobacteria bacterium]